MTGLAAYRKTIVTMVGSVLTWAGVAYVPDGHIDRPEWYALCLALATVLGVYAVTNDGPPMAPEATPVALTPTGQVPLTTSRDDRGRYAAGALMAEPVALASGE